MKTQNYSRPREDLKWTGWAIDPKFLPLKEMEEEGYGVEEVEDERGRYFKIIKLTLEK